MKCPNCNNNIPDGSKFCNHCGQHIEESNDVILCSNPECGKAIPSDSNFCPFCGGKIINNKACRNCGANDLPLEAQYCFHCGCVLNEESMPYVNSNESNNLPSQRYKVVDLDYEYDTIDPCSCGLFAVERNGLWGFINKTGKEVIPCIYDKVDSFSEGLSLVSEQESDPYFININGEKELVPSSYPSGQRFSEGLFQTFERINGVWLHGYFDKSGQITICYKFRRVEDFSEGLAFVQDQNGKIGYIDHSGEYVISPKYLKGSYFRKGYAVVEDVNNTYLLIDNKGNTIYKFNGIIDYGLGILLGHGEESLFYKVKDLNELINPLSQKEIHYKSWESVHGFSDGYATIYDQVDEKCKLINENGETQQIDYDDIYPFSCGYAVVVKNDKKGLIDKTLQEVVPCVFDDIDYVYEGTTVVTNNDIKQLLLIE